MHSLVRRSIFYAWIQQTTKKLITVLGGSSFPRFWAVSIFAADAILHFLSGGFVVPCHRAATIMTPLSQPPTIAALFSRHHDSAFGLGWAPTVATTHLAAVRHSLR